MIAFFFVLEGNVATNGRRRIQNGRARRSAGNPSQNGVPRRSKRKFHYMNFDCWSKIFDLLSFHDILAMTRTCQRMREYGGQYFRENFYGTVMNLYHTDAIFAQDGHEFHFQPDDFVRFIDTICISRKFHRLRHWIGGDILRSLTTLIFKHSHLNEGEFYGYENVFNQIERVYMDHCSIHECFIRKFLDAAPKLQRLYLKSVYFKTTAAKNEIFQRTFPKLQFFEYTECRKPIPGFVPFLERNPTIKHVCINDYNVFEISHEITSDPTVHLDWLSIRIDSNVSSAVDTGNRLKTMHSNGFYKKLNVKLTKNETIGQAFVNKMNSFQPLEVFYTHCFYENMQHLTGLRDLHIRRLPHEVDVEPIARNLALLERLTLGGSTKQLSYFLRYSKSLKTAIFCNLHSNHPLNLAILNEIRRLSGVPHKIRIGLYEKVYLATKWKQKNISYDLIEVFRVQTIWKTEYLTIPKDN